MKKIIVALVAAVLACSFLVGCSSFQTGLASEQKVTSGLYDANDGKILSVIPDSQAIALLNKFGFKNEANFISEAQRNGQLWNTIPDGSNLKIQYSLKSTGQVLDPKDIVRTVYFQSTTDNSIPTPNFGPKFNVEVIKPFVPIPAVTNVPVVVPPVIVTNAPAPIVTNIPPVVVVTNAPTPVVTNIPVPVVTNLPPVITNSPPDILVGPDNGKIE